MNNCLVTKLTSSVNNPDLPTYGEFKFKIYSTTALTICGVSSKNGKIILPDGQSINLSNGTIVKLNGYNLKVDDEIKYYNKYDNMINFDSNSGATAFKIYLDDLTYCNLTYANFIGCVLSGEYDQNIIHEETQELNILNSSIADAEFRKIENLVKNFPNVTFSNIANSGIYGDIIEFKTWKNHVYSNTLYLNVDLYGDIYELIVEWRKVGKNRQNFYIYTDNDEISFFDVSLPKMKNLLFAWTDDYITITVDSTTTKYDNSGHVIS